jgi:hypothetical protein
LAKFEFKIISLNSADREKSERNLNEMGANGWQLVGITSHNQGVMTRKAQVNK